jgi:hypothetical protein
MKNTLIFLLVLLQTSFLYGAVVKKKVVLRDENFKVTIEEVILSDLTSEDSYEGKYFKIVSGKSDEAILFTASKDLQLKAATTYYHLNKARKYFIDTVQSDYVRDLPQLTIRLDLINVFNEVGHFANNALDPQFNNALSVPAGKGYEPKDIKPWNTEIWFRPSKEIRLNGSDSSSVKVALQSFRNQTHMQTLQQFLITLLQGKIGGYSISSNSIMRTVGSSLLIEAIYQSTDIAASFFAQKIYRLDAALVPEIIYHEFAHIALSDHLELSHSTPVNEGLADYFAGQIANSKKLATKIKDYNLFNGKQVKKKQQYNQAFERGDFANTDFVFGLLWNVGEIIGKEKEARFMYAMTHKIDSNDTIRDGLIKATLDTCRENCTDEFNDTLKLYKLYDSRNM